MIAPHKCFLASYLLIASKLENKLVVSLSCRLGIARDTKTYCSICRVDCKFAINKEKVVVTFSFRPLRLDRPHKGPRPLEQCRVRSVEVRASTSVAAAASRDVQLQTWYRKLIRHPSYYSLLLPLYVLHRPHSTQE
jgi:hypothetical protein